MRSAFICFLIVVSSLLKAQERRSGIKLLVKDKLTGLSFPDSLVITADDTLSRKMLSDASGYYYFELPPGSHSISAGHVGYQTSGMKGIMVAEQKTSYITLMLDKSTEEKPKKRKGGVKLKMRK